MFQVQRLDHVAIRVADLGRSTAHYEDVLGMEVRAHYRDVDGRGAPPVLCSGDACLALFPAEAGRSVVPLQGHIAFRLSRAAFDEARDHLRLRDIAFKYVQYPTVHSVYFPDPDGYEIELSTYEF